MINIVVADDHSIVRAGLIQLLHTLADVSIAAEAENGVEAIAAVKRHKPDILTLDISMPYAGGLEVISEVRHWSPNTRIVVFTGVATTGVVGELMDAGVEGLLLKSCSNEELQEGLLAVLAGDNFCCKEATAIEVHGGVFATLTGREKQVLQQLLLGSANADIANILNISSKTVDNHRTNLMRKLDVHSIASLIQLALKEGLMPPSPDLD